MGKEIPWDIREHAEELYIVDRLTFEQVAQQTDVSATQLKNWAAAGEWREKREEYRASLQEIKSNTIKLRRALIAKAVKSLDPQDIYAAVRLENAATKQAKKDGVAPDIDRPRIFLENMEFVADVLKEIDPEGLKILARNFETILIRFKDHEESRLKAIPTVS